MTPRTACAALAGLVIATVAACALKPDVGPLLAGSCDDTDTNPDVSVSFSAQIRPLITRSVGGCSCHLPGASGPTNAIQISGLDLSSFASLRAGGVTSGTRIVIPMMPCESVLYQKLDNTPPFGNRMPLGGPFFTADELALVHDWIAEGGADN